MKSRISYLLVCGLIFLFPISSIAQVDFSLIEFSGKVHENGKGISGIAVTDGYNIVVTDAKGKYKFESNTTVEFVYITLPAGYDIPYTDKLPRFYVPITDKTKKHQIVDFELKKSTKDDNKHVAIAWADPQVYTQEDVEKCKEAADDLKELVKKNYAQTPVHGIVCGDIVGDASTLYDTIKGVITSTTVPFFYLPGNHDLNMGGRSDEGSKSRYKQNFGPDFYSFNRGKIHYVVLSDVFYVARGYSYIAYLPERQMNWLKQDLALIPAGSTVVVSLHIPTYSKEAMRKEYNKEAMSQVLQNRSSLYELLKPFQTHIFSGHIHSNDNYVIADNLYEHNHAAICGIFWQGPDCADGTPPGYGVYEADGDRFTWKYKTVGKDIDHQFRAYPVGSNPEKPNALTALVWNYDPAWKVYWYEDGEKKGEMTQYIGHDPQTAAYIRENKASFTYEWIGTKSSDHLFMAEPVSPTAKMKVEVIDRFGNVYTQEVKKEETSSTKTIYLDELDTKNLLQDWGGPIKNKSINNTPFKVAGVEYERGIGTHSISRYLLNLEGKALTFSGYAGADDANDFTCNMEFKLIADQKEIWSSGVLHKGMPAKPFQVSLQGVQKLLLLVKEAGDGIMYDHADWLNARFETVGKITPEPVVPKNIPQEKYILTPKPKEFPQINSPKVFGVRPGSPFLYTIAATGKRPMAFSAGKLPEGLTLDAQTGQISGTITKTGTYSVLLKATNNLGEDRRILTVKVGNEIGLTPPMGWNSWNCWGLKVDEQRVKESADFMSAKLIDHGWSYINIDDGWQAPNRTADGVLLGNERFPDFRKLSDYVHSRGLKFGIYSSPGPETCGRYQGSYQYEKIDAETWMDWGVDYLKYDYCLYTEVAPDASEKSIQAPYIVMKKELDKINRDIVYCVGFGAPNVWNWAAEAGGNHWRTTRDITDDWNVLLAIGSFQDVCAQATKPGNYNDPDMLVVGKLGMGIGTDIHQSNLTPDEQYTHVSLWSLLSAPLLIGCDMNDIDDFTLSLLTNDEVIAVDQDPLVKPAKKIITSNGQIWYKPLEDGSIAVGLFNIDPYFILWNQEDGEKIQQEKYAMTLNFDQLGLKGRYKIRDLWRQEDLGVYKNTFTAEVPYHGVKLIKLTPSK